MRQAALVTGAARRLGRSIALHLASKGYDIALHYHSSKADAEKTAQDIAALGVTCELIPADLADNTCYEDVINRSHQAFPWLSVLVNNAAVFDRATLTESDTALYAKEFRINLEAPIFLTRAFANTVGKGCVVNILDTHVTRHTHSYFLYLLTKKSLLEFTRMAAVELAPQVRVNGVCPGFTLPSQGWDEAFRKKLEAHLPMGKTASPEEVAQAVYMLVETSLTGQVIFVDGGESLL